MKVRELVEQLRGADSDATVLWLDEYGDLDEADEVRQVDVRVESWAHEVGFRGDERYEVLCPGPANEPKPGCRDVVLRELRVVVLSSGPSNLTRAK